MSIFEDFLNENMINRFSNMFKGLSVDKKFLVHFVIILNFITHMLFSNSIVWSHYAIYQCNNDPNMNGCETISLFDENRKKIFFTCGWILYVPEVLYALGHPLVKLLTIACRCIFIIASYVMYYDALPIIQDISMKWVKYYYIWNSLRILFNMCSSKYFGLLNGLQTNMDILELDKYEMVTIDEIPQCTVANKIDLDDLKV